MASAERTQDHATIMDWIKTHGGHPAVVRDTEEDVRGVGLLRVKFDEREECLKEVEWNEFFETFDENELTFIYQDDEPGSRESNFCRFIQE